MALTEAQVQELERLKQQEYELSARAGAPNPEGKYAGSEEKRQAFEIQRLEYQKQLSEVRERTGSLTSLATPEQRKVFDEGGGRSQFQAEAGAVGLWGGNILDRGQYHYSSSPEEKTDQETFAKISSFYKYAPSQSVTDFFVTKSIDETELRQKDIENQKRLFGKVVQEKEIQGFSRSMKSLNNTSIAYEATLAARQQGLNVGSGLVYNLAPTYQKNYDKLFGEHNKVISLTENITTERPKNYFVGFTEGGRGVTTAYKVELNESLGGERKRVRASNQNEIKKEYEANKANLLGFISGAKKQGATRISIFDESGKVIKESSIDRAFYEVSKASKSGIVTIKAGGDIVEKIVGYTQDEKGKIGTTKIQGEQFKTGLFIEQNKIVEKPDGTKTITPITEWSKSLEASERERRSKANDPLSSAIRTLSSMSKHSTNPLIAGTSGMFAEGLSGAATILNIANIGADALKMEKIKKENTFVKTLVQPTPQNATAPQPEQQLITPQIETAQTSASDLIGSITGGASLAYTTKNPKALSKIGEGLSGYYTAITTKPAKTIGETIGFIMPVGAGSLSKIAKISEQGFEIAADTTKAFTKYTVTATRAGETIGEKSFKTFEKAIEFQAKYKTLGEVETKITAIQTPIKSFQIAGKNIISKINDRYAIGSPTRQPKELVKAFAEISPTGRGLEVGSLEKYGRDILTSEAGGYALVEAGKLTPAGIIELKKDIEIAKILERSRKHIKPKIQNELTEIGSLSGEKENKALFGKILSKSKVAIKGGMAQSAQVRESLIKSTPRFEVKDVDRDFTRSFLGRAYKKLGMKQSASDLSHELALKDVTRAKEILEKVAEKGRAFEIKGTKLVAGEADETKPRFEIDLKSDEVLHGTDKGSAREILSKGIDVKASQRSSGFFTTPKTELAEQFAKRAGTKTGKEPVLLKSTLEKEKILDYSTIPKKDRLKLIDEDWLKYQTNVIEYAKEKGFLGVTKPYKTTRPDTDKIEVIIFDKSAIKPESIIKPTGFEIKEGTEKKVLENLSERDALSGSPGSKHDAVFGTKYKYDIVKQIVKDEEKRKLGTTKKTIPYRSLIDQTLSKLVSTASIQGPRTEKFAGEGIPDFLKPEGKLPTTKEGFGLTSPESRLKDTFDLVKLDLPETALRLIESGDKGAAKEGIRLLELSKDIEALHPEIEWGKIGSSVEKAEFDTDMPSRLSRYGIDTTKSLKGITAGSIKIAGGFDREKSAFRRDSNLSVTKDFNDSIVSMSRSNIVSRNEPSRPSISDSRASEISKSLGSKPSLVTSRPSAITSKLSSASITGSMIGKYGISPNKSATLSAITGHSGASITGSPSSMATSITHIIKSPPIKTPSRIVTKIPLLNTRYEKEKKTREKRPDDFLGGSSISKVEGLYNSDITVGISKSAKLHSKRLGLESKGRGVFSSGHATKNKLSGLTSNKKIRL